MSQIRKLQGGGNTSNWGKLIIDGTEYNMNDENVRKAFLNHLSTTSNDYGDYYSDILNVLRSGQNITGDSIANRLTSGINSFSVNTDKENEILNSYENDRKKVRDARKNNGVHKGKVAINNVLSFKMPEEKKTQNEINNDLKVFEYSDEGGFAQNSAINQGLRDRIKYYYDYFSDPGTWGYKWSSPQYGASEGDLKAWYQSLGTDYESRRKEIERLVTDALTEAESAKSWDDVSSDSKRILSYFNIGVPKESSSSSNSDLNKTKQKTIKKWQDAGYTSDQLYDIIGDSFELTDDGVLTLKPGVEFNLGNWHNGRNVYFNDDFYRSQYGVDGRYNALKGLTYYNGKLYQNNSSALAQILNISGGYNDLVKNGDYIGADKIILTRFTPEEMENPGTLSPDSYSSFITPGMQFSNLTGLYTLKDGSMGKGDQLIQYVDLNNPEQDGPYVHYNYKFALLDSNGNKIRDDITREDLSKIVGGKSVGNLITYKKISNRNSGKYANKYYEDVIGNNGKYSGIRIYRDIENPNSDVILHVDGLRGPAEDKDVVLPKSVAEVLMEDQSWVDKIVSNTKARENFTNMLESLGESKFSRNFDNWWEWTIPFFFRGVNSSDVDYRRSKLATFMSQNQAKKLQKALVDASKGNRFDRRESYYLDTPEFKNGGKVQYIIKLAGGGVSGGTKTSEGVSERRVAKKIRNPKNAASLSEIGGDNWTTADTNDLVALGADLASLGLAFVPGANVASTATGVASSLARFEADRQRKTSGAGLQLGINLAMDAATLLPFAGGAFKTTKIVKAVKSALPTIIKAASVYGLGSAVVTSAKKIANGEKFTVRDLSNVVNGITAGVGVARAGGFGKQSKSATRGYSETVKVGDTDVTLNDTQLKEIMHAADQPKALREAISAQAEGVSQEQVAKAAEKLLKEKKTLWQKVFRKDGDIGLSAKKKKLPGRAYTEQEIADMSGLERWWRGLDGYQQAYRRALVNEQPSNVTTIRKVEPLSSVSVGSKQIKFTDAELADLQATPVMQQFAKFKQLAKTKAAGLSDTDLETAFRNLLVETPNRFNIVFNERASGSRFIGETPSWYRRRTEDLLSRVTNDEGVKITRTRKYDTRMPLARPQVLFTSPSTDSEYVELPGTVYNPIFDKGGVLKAQSGTYNLGFNSKMPYKINIFTGKPELNLPASGSQLQLSNPLIPLKSTQSNISSNSTSQPSGTTSTQTTGIQTTGTSATGQSNHPGPGGPIGEMTIQDPNNNWFNAELPFSFIRLAGILGGINKRYPKVTSAPQMGSLNWTPIPTSSTALDHYENELNQQLSSGLEATTADPILHYAAKLSQQAQLNANKRDLIAQKSALEQQTNTQNAHDWTEISNQNVLNSYQNAQARDAKEMAKNQLEAAKETEKQASIQQMLYELQNRVFQDQQYRTLLNTQDYASKLEDGFNNYLAKLSNTDWNNWNRLSPEQQSEYSGFDEYLSKVNPTVYGDNKLAIEKRRKDINNAIKLSRLRGRVNFPGTFKKGGRLNGVTRYTLEPDERIWIDNNKAAHAKIAKLNDNAIKLLLRALK